MTVDLSPKHQLSSTQTFFINMPTKQQLSLKSRIDLTKKEEINENSETHENTKPIANNYDTKKHSNTSEINSHSSSATSSFLIKDILKDGSDLETFQTKSLLNSFPQDLSFRSSLHSSSLLHASSNYPFHLFQRQLLSKECNISSNNEALNSNSDQVHDSDDENNDDNCYSDDDEDNCGKSVKSNISKLIVFKKYIIYQIIIKLVLTFSNHSKKN